MARCVRDDEGAVVCREVPVRDIDCDALLALLRETVEKQGVVDRAAAASDLGVELESLLLVRVEKLGILQDMSDQRRFSVVNTAAGNEFQ